MHFQQPIEMGDIRTKNVDSLMKRNALSSHSSASKQH